ncbi:hypothetical protein [Sphingobacterium daejeonense]|uniref:hypothetical protein n=1 Tax=Sphingobacterium daejeonense TaxID=371142 RepID=UPI0010C3918A|nr:hypothetical protein [Sphingobacterium daejeonense]VTP96058.1 Uncharacterised protein [Sphingobacterium daejeonense]
MKFIKKSTIVLALSAFAFISCQKEEASYEELTDTKDGVFLSVQKAVNGYQDLQLFPQIAERKTCLALIMEVWDYHPQIYKLFSKKTRRLWIVSIWLGKIEVKKNICLFLRAVIAIDKNSATIKSGQLSSEFLTFDL